MSEKENQVGAAELEFETLNEQEHHSHEHHHHHHKHRSKVKPVMYTVMAFFLSLVLFLLSGCMVLYFSIFSKDYMIGTMKSIGYSDMVRSELQVRLEDLVSAGGFDKGFAEKFAAGYDVQKAVEEYITSFYSGESTLIDTTGFKQDLYLAINEYIREKGITVSDSAQSSIAYFVNEAADIYVDQISITFFSTIANYIYKSRTILNITTAVLAVIALVIIAVIYLTNEYKHRRSKYLFYATAGGFLAVLALPCIFFITNKLKNINLNTRSLYNLFVNYFNGMFSQFYIWAGVLFIISVIVFLLYRRHYLHATA